MSWDKDSLIKKSKAFTWKQREKKNLYLPPAGLFSCFLRPGPQYKNLVQKTKVLVTNASLFRCFPCLCCWPLCHPATLWSIWIGCAILTVPLPQPFSHSQSNSPRLQRALMLCQLCSAVSKMLECYQHLSGCNCKAQNSMVKSRKFIPSQPGAIWQFILHGFSHIIEGQLISRNFLYEQYFRLVTTGFPHIQWQEKHMLRDWFFTNILDFLF